MNQFSNYTYVVITLENLHVFTNHFFLPPKNSYKTKKIRPNKILGFKYFGSYLQRMSLLFCQDPKYGMN